MENKELLKELINELIDSDKKITITIEPNNGLSGSQVEEARKKGREGDEIRF